MGYQDRPYYRDREGGSFNPLTWALSGSVPLFTAFNIRVRAHASLLIFIVLVLIFGLGRGYTVEDRVQSMSMLFAIVLLHEFGHCFAARWVGGEANDILMHPLGGLAMTRPPHRPLPTFITVAAGPAVNVVICIVCGIILWSVLGLLPWNPINPEPLTKITSSMFSLVRWTYWIYGVSYMLLIFNLLPIFPLDGGQMVQAALWPWLGYYKSMNFACITGVIGAGLLAGFGLATGSLFLVLLAVSGGMYCIQLRRALMAAGPEEYADTVDYSAAYENPRPKRQSNWAAKRAMKLKRAEAQEQERIDQILAKVSAKGMHSLNWMERRALRKATENQKKRSNEMSHLRKM